MRGMGLSFLGPPGVDRLGANSVTRRGFRAANSRPLAAVIPGDTVAEGFVVTGLVNFFGIYQNLIISRILLSWFPALQRQPILQPIYTVCDPFLNVFRGKPCQPGCSCLNIVCHRSSIVANVSTSLR
uniref:Uncharacterized protein n=1 Tax=Rhodosorus marinus TaxID=101924 RepID=A0A7S0BVM0_9RHOD|mmetsp:Transcript_9722/g.14164  ORF Transcript_9722/g.14164 Transcript_9722/m.14164 type:complete len:127 (+) Transcript_9722:187-567(+)